MKGGSPRSRMLWTFAVTSLALVMVTLDNLVVTTALPVIRTDLAREPRGARVDGQRLHAHLRRAAPDRRRARRPLRAPADVRDRARRSSRSPRRRPRSRRRWTCSSPPGRSRALGGAIVDAADPDDPLRGGAGREARRRARRLGRDRRPRRRPRPARRRRGRLRPLLAVDLLDQRADRPRADPARAAAARRDATARPTSSTSRASASSAPACFGIVWGLVRGNGQGWTSPEIVLVARSAARSSSPAFVLWELRAATPMLPMRFFRNRTFAMTNVASLLMFFGMFGSIFLLAQFFQTVQGYSPFGSGLRILPWTAMPIFVAPIAGALSDRIGGRPLMALGPRAPGDRARLDRRDRRRRRPPYADLVAPFVISGHRDGALLRAGRERRPLVGPAGRKRARRRAPTTRSASSAASSASPCSPRSSRTTAATGPARPSSTG